MIKNACCQTQMHIPFIQMPAHIHIPLTCLQTYNHTQRDKYIISDPVCSNAHNHKTECPLPFPFNGQTHTSMHAEAVEHPCEKPHRACAIPAAICPAFILPVDDPLDAAGSLTIAAIQPIHLLLRPGQLHHQHPPPTHPKDKNQVEKKT